MMSQDSFVAPANMTQQEFDNCKYFSLKKLDISDNEQIFNLSHLDKLETLIVEPNNNMHRTICTEAKQKNIQIQYKNSNSNIHTNAKKMLDLEMKAICNKLINM